MDADDLRERIARVLTQADDVPESWWHRDRYLVRADAVLDSLRAAGVLREAPSRCPTCGSDEPALRLAKWNSPPRNTSLGPCLDLWHTVSVGEDHDG